MSKMKIKVISRNPDDYLRATKRDIHKLPRNYDPSLHPLEAPREYVRAMNAVKLERVFAKPFIGNLDGHKDGVSSIAKHPSRLAVLASGAFDGEIRLWDLAVRKCTRNFVAHEGWVRALCYTPKGDTFTSVGDDKTIKTWKAELQSPDDEEPINTCSPPSVATTTVSVLCASHPWATLPSAIYLSLIRSHKIDSQFLTQRFILTLNNKLTALKNKHIPYG